MNNTVIYIQHDMTIRQYYVRRQLDSHNYFHICLKLVKFERKFADCKNLHRYFGISA